MLFYLTYSLFLDHRKLLEILSLLILIAWQDHFSTLAFADAFEEILDSFANWLHFRFHLSWQIGHIYNLMIEIYISALLSHFAKIIITIVAKILVKILMRFCFLYGLCSTIIIIKLWRVFIIICRIIGIILLVVDKTLCAKPAPALNAIILVIKLIMDTAFISRDLYLLI